MLTASYGTVRKGEGSGRQSSGLEYAKPMFFGPGVRGRTQPTYPQLHIYTYNLYTHIDFCTNSATLQQSMTVISFLNQKGGVGKTTLALHVAAALAQSSRVLVVDADPQGSALDWAAARSKDPVAFPVIGLPKSNLHKQIPSIGRDYQWVIVDGPPRVNEISKAAIAASDLVVIPVLPSPFDVWAAEEILTLIAECAVITPRLQARFVVNRLFPGTTLAREVTDALAALPDKVPIFTTAIRNRTEYAKALRAGGTALETQRNGPAAHDVLALIDEFVTLLQPKEDHRDGE